MLMMMMMMMLLMVVTMMMMMMMMMRRRMLTVCRRRSGPNKQNSSQWFFVGMISANCLATASASKKQWWLTPCSTLLGLSSVQMIQDQILQVQNALFHKASRVLACLESTPRHAVFMTQRRQTYIHHPYTSPEARGQLRHQIQSSTPLKKPYMSTWQSRSSSRLTILADVPNQSLFTVIDCDPSKRPGSFESQLDEPPGHCRSSWRSCPASPILS